MSDFGASVGWKHECEGLEPEIFLIAWAVGAPLDRLIADAESLGACLPSRAARASEKSSIEMAYTAGIIGYWSVRNIVCGRTVCTETVVG